MSLRLNRFGHRSYGQKSILCHTQAIETGSYLLLAGAVVFILCQRLIAGNEKTHACYSCVKKQDPEIRQKRRRKLLMISVSVLTFGALLTSLFLRNNLPELRPDKPGRKEKAGSKRK
jgi:hypothetical protein